MVFKVIHQRRVVRDQDDDSSVSSAITVDSLSIDPRKQLPLDFIRPNKRVRFDMTKNVAQHIESEDSDDSEKWYSSNEYHQFKQVARETAHAITEVEKENHAPNSYQRVLERTFAACSEGTSDNDDVLSSSELIHLQRWLEIANSSCGLEKWSILKISRDYKIRRGDMTQIVMERQHNSINSSIDEEEINNMDELMRECCENISRTSRLYARTWAQALALVVEKQHDEDQFMARLHCKYSE